MEGSASAGLAGVLWYALPASIEAAPWLEPGEKAWLRQQLDLDHGHHVGSQGHGRPQGQQGQHQEELEWKGGSGGRQAAPGSNLMQDDASMLPDASSPQDEEASSQHAPLVGGGAPPSAPGPQPHQRAAGGRPAAGGRGRLLSGGQALRQVVAQPTIWYLTAMKALKDTSLDGLVYWVPSLVRGGGAPAVGGGGGLLLEAGLLGALPGEGAGGWST